MLFKIFCVFSLSYGQTIRATKPLTRSSSSSMRRCFASFALSNDPDEDMCFDGTWALNARTLSKWFPTLTIVYQPNVTLNLQPENYVYRHRTDRHAFCLGIFDGQKERASWSGNVWWGILLGQLTLRDTPRRESEGAGWKVSTAHRHGSVERSRCRSPAQPVSALPARRRVRGN